MSGQRPDVSRLYEHCGLDPSQYLQVSDDLPRRYASELAASVAATAARNPRGLIRDPALRSALLRARLLRDDSH
ncbi:MAG: hypothetical protein ACREUE_03965 [Panacagrimonas sp.]